VIEFACCYTIFLLFVWLTLCLLLYFVYYSIKISVFTLYTLVFYALQWKSSAHLPWCVTHTVWVCKAHYYKVCFALSASKCALHTKKSVRIETCPAHLIWCAQHTTVFTVHDCVYSLSTFSLPAAMFQHSHPTHCGGRTNNHSGLPCGSGSTERTILIQLEERTSDQRTRDSIQCWPTKQISDYC